MRVGVYKPVASGCEMRDGKLVSPDAIALWTAAGEPGTLDAVCPQRFAAPLAPHLAARAEGRRVDAALLRNGLEYWRERCDVVLVEGAGGLMSPISDADYNADLAADFNYPLIVVASNELGTINATLQTLITASTCCPARSEEPPTGYPPRTENAEGLTIAGIVLNSPRNLTGDASVDSNADELERRCVPPLLAVVDHNGGFNRDVNWEKFI
jgi:dethiobiotin synthetase